MDDQIDYFFERLTEKTPLTLKRVKGRNYGHIRFVPESAIVVYVKKKSVSISFETEGKENALQSIEHVKWAEENKDYFAAFNLRAGKRNKEKSTLIREFPFTKAEDLTEDAFINDCFKAVQLLIDKIKLVASPNESLSELTDPKQTDKEYDSKGDTGVDGQAADSCPEQGDAQAANKYVFVVELNIEEDDYMDCNDDSYNPEFTNPLYELTEAFTARVEDEFDCFAPGYLFEDGKPRLLMTPGDLWTHVFYAKQDGLIDEMRAQIVFLLSDCNHWDYNFIKAAQHAEIPGFTVFGYYPNAGKIGRQGYCGDDLDTGVYLADREEEDTEGYTGEHAITYNGIPMSVFELKPYLEVIAPAT
jgi:hypothetical protein